MNKSAREMFIDLDFEYREDKNYIYIYENSNKQSDELTEFIMFDKKDKITHFEPFHVEGKEYNVDFFQDEAKAINKQWEELGWLDE